MHDTKNPVKGEYSEGFTDRTPCCASPISIGDERKGDDMKQRIYENWRVIVTPEEPWLVDKKDKDKFHDAMIGTCKGLIGEIKRHCDGFTDVDFDVDSKEVCEYCGTTWEDIDPNDPCFCCDKAEDEYEKSHVR